MEIKLDLSNCATKSDTSKSARKVKITQNQKFMNQILISSLKSTAGKLYLDKLAHVCIDIKKLSDVVDNDVIEKAVYDKLFNKVNAIHTRDLLKKSDDSKIDEIKGEIPSITDLGTLYIKLMRLKMKYTVFLT